MADLYHVALALMLDVALLTELGRSELIKVLNDIVAELLQAGLLVLQELVEDIPPA